MPTILDVLGVEAPEAIKGHAQSRFDGVSMRYSFDDAAAPTDAAHAVLLDARLAGDLARRAGRPSPPTRRISGWSHFNDDEWELYHTDVDRSELHNLAAEHPEKVRELVEPLVRRGRRQRRLPARRPLRARDHHDARGRCCRRRANRYVYFPDTAEVPESQAVNIRNRSFAIGALVDIPAPGAEGVLFAHGSRFGGHALYVKDNRLHYVYNFVGHGRAEGRRRPRTSRPART